MTATHELTITDQTSRDHGKTFILTEMTPLKISRLINMVVRYISYDQWTDIMSTTEGGELYRFFLLVQVLPEGRIDDLFAAVLEGLQVVRGDAPARPAKEHDIEEYHTLAQLHKLGMVLNFARAFALFRS